jgi:parallel beta-helix repeat protein
MAVSPTVPTNGMQITESVTFAPGVYVLPDGVTLAADGVTLDGGGALLVGAGDRGSGVAGRGLAGVTVRNLALLQYQTGIRLTDCRDVTLAENRVSRTAELERRRYFLEIWLPAEQAYGAGIFLERVRGGVIRDNDLQHQQNGLSCYGCTRLTIEQNDASYCSGWGFCLYDSSDNLLQRNLADFCNRIYRREDGSEHVGADAAGLLVIWNSCRNRVLRNSLRGSGDGVFVAGYRHPGQIAPCNDNLFEENDGSLSPNIAFEATFCSGNLFRRNQASDGNYGFWLGFSTHTRVEENEVHRNRRAGIAIEHGHDNAIRANRFRENRHGVQLWSGGAREFTEVFPDRRDSCATGVRDNLFETNRVGFLHYTGTEWEPRPGGVYGHGYRLEGNRFAHNRLGIHLADARDCILRGNAFEGNVEGDVRLERCEGIEQEG